MIYSILKGTVFTIMKISIKFMPSISGFSLILENLILSWVLVWSSMTFFRCEIYAEQEKKESVKNATISSHKSISRFWQNFISSGDCHRWIRSRTHHMAFFELSSFFFLNFQFLWIILRIFDTKTQNEMRSGKHIKTTCSECPSYSYSARKHHRICSGSSNYNHGEERKQDLF